MHQDLIRDILDTLWLAKKAIESLPPLPQGFKPSHIRVLDAIWQRGATNANIRISDISNTMQIAKPNMTNLINELCQLGALSKQTSTADKRVIHIKLSAYGLACIEKYVTGYHAELATALGKLDEARCRSMLSTLQLTSRTIMEVSAMHNKETASHEK